MKPIAVALVSASLSLVAMAADESDVKFIGIAHVGKRDVVLLEIKRPGGGFERPILGIGERTDGIEVVSIDSSAATVTLNQGVKEGDRLTSLTKVTKALDSDGANGKVPKVNIQKADARQVLELYQQLSGRTVIASSSLPVARITVRSDADPAGVVAQALVDQGIVITPRLDKFAFATTTADVQLVEQFKAPPAPQNDPKEKPFPAGLIMFRDADRLQVLNIYQELLGRTLIVSPRLPSAKVSVRSETKLTREEAAWVLESALQLSGINATAPYEKFAFVSAPADASRLARIQAPPQPSKDPNVERFPPGLIKFAEADIHQVLDIYGQLAGRTLDKAPDLPLGRFTFRSQTELTRDEAVWLVESALQLGGIRFVQAGDNQVKVTNADNN